MVEGIIDYLNELMLQNKDKIEAIQPDLRVKLFYIQKNEIDSNEIKNFSQQLKLIVYLLYLQNFKLLIKDDFDEFLIIFKAACDAVPIIDRDRVKPFLIDALNINLKLYIFKSDLSNIKFIREKIEYYRDFIDYEKIIIQFCIRVMSIFENFIKEGNILKFKSIILSIPSTFKNLNPSKDFTWFFRHLKIYFESLRKILEKEKENLLKSQKINELGTELNSNLSTILKNCEKLENFKENIQQLIESSGQNLDPSSINTDRVWFD